MYFGKEMCHFGMYSEHSEQNAIGGKTVNTVLVGLARRRKYSNLVHLEQCVRNRMGVFWIGNMSFWGVF